ncbi:hypothetical protein F5Y11DRAFT_162536 [Daldinia sp. FL1419]|nr:hypothetical protein F5Y11DRAFT_162536 [Daldinia sp. FL1419]
MPNTRLGGSSAQHKSQKRNRDAYENNGASHLPHKPSLRAATSPSGPFQTIRVTKSNATNGRIPLSKMENALEAPYDITPYSIPTPYQFGNQQNHDFVVEPLDQLDVVYSSFIADNLPRVPIAFPNTPKSIDASRNLDRNRPVGTTFIGRPTSSGYLGNTHPRNTVGNDNGILAKSIKQENVSIDAGDNVQDEYPLDNGLTEDDMTRLLKTALDSVQEVHLPPSSLTLAWDYESRSAAEYDPNLQHSSPDRLSPLQTVHASGNPDSGQDDLGEDVDWNAVYTMKSTIPNDVSNTNSPDTANALLRDHIAYKEELTECNAHIEDILPLRPFVRPPFPEKVRDRSAVSELSPRTVLRTCFRIGELVNEAVHCLRNRQDVVFELFARVTYSSRESLQRNQHFQFIDLFKDQLPYPVGILSNWRVGTQLDRQSAAFLNTSVEPKLCRCVCKPRRDPNVAIGLTLVVTAIREIDWAHIRLVKRMVCGGSDDAARGVVTQQNYENQQWADE